MSNLRRLIHLPSLLVFLTVTIGAGFVAEKWTGMGFWAGFALAALAMVFLGWVAVAEDELPGGFNNPLPHQVAKDPTSTADQSREQSES